MVFHHFDKDTNLQKVHLYEFLTMPESSEVVLSYAKVLFFQPRQKNALSFQFIALALLAPTNRMLPSFS
jgi:hypothetical protein